MKMKTQIKRKGKRMLSLLLAVMLIVSTMVVGIVSVNAAGTVIYLDISNAKDKFSSNRVYVSATAASNNGFSADNSDTSGANSYVPKNDKWYKMTKVGGNIYQATIDEESPVGKYSFWANDESSYDRVWSTSCTLGRSYDGTNNLFTLSKANTKNEGRNSEIYGGSWSEYTNSVVTSVTLTASKTEVEPNETVTLTATAIGRKVDWIGYVLKKNGKEIDTIAGGVDSAPFTITPTETAKYTVEAYADGYDSIISDELTIKVNLPDVASSVSLESDKSSVVRGSSATLTANVVGKATQDDVTLTLEGSDSSTQTQTVSGDITSATFSVNPESDTTYTVTASATGYNSKTSDEVTVAVTTPDVANSVSLSTSAKSVVEGNSATLTATITGKAADSVTLKLVDGNGATVGEPQTVTGNSAEFTVTPSAKTTYKVVASADNFNNVESNEVTIDVVIPKTYYLWTSPKSNLSDSSTWTKNTMSYNDDGTYSFDYTFSTTDDCYVTITESDTNHYSTMVWSGSTDKLTNSSTILKETRVQNYNVGEVRYYYPQLIPAKTGTITITFSDTEKTIVVTDSGATPTEPTTEEPTTEEPTTEEPSTSPSTAPTTQPTTTPSADTWYLKGSFNSWGTTNPLVGSDNVLTTNVFINSSTVYTLKVWNKNDGKYYGSTVVNPAVAAEIKDLQLGYYVDGGETRNVKFQPSQSGVYKFTFNPTTLKLTAELVSTSSLNAEVSAPESVKAGETFSITAKAILDESSAITPASYKFTIKVGNTTVVNGVTSTTDQYTYNRASISTPSAVSAYVEAYDADGNLLGVSPTVEKTVSVTYEDFSVKLSSDNAEVAKESVVTFTASATPASYASSFDFYVSKNEDFADAEPVSQTLSTYKYTFNEVGTYYVKVVAHNRYAAVTNALDTATSNVLVINVFETLGEHKVNFYFKAPSAFAYKPKMVLDGNTLTVERDANLGASYSGSVTFYWFKATATVDSSVEHELVITTQRTSASGSIKGHCYDNNYWFAIDNLMNGKELVNLSSSQEYIRNYYHSPLHTVYAGSADDGTLGFTNIGGTRYAMGTYTEGDPSQNVTLSIKAATAAQKVVTQLDTYSEVQTCLLDVNLDGKVDVKDATMIQKAIVSLI